jgi:hypothetical protein
MITHARPMARCSGHLRLLAMSLLMLLSGPAQSTVAGAGSLLQLGRTKAMAVELLFSGVHRARLQLCACCTQVQQLSVGL